jgi:hypothetical protein
MTGGDSLLVSLVHLVDSQPFLSRHERRNRGRLQTYSDRLLIKALLIMIIRRLHTALALLAFLQQPDDPVVQQLRPLLMEHRQFPSRRT